MAWTTPKTWAFQEGVESSELNTHLRDNLLAVGPHLISLKTSDQVLSTSMQDVTSMGATVGATEVWRLEFWFVLSVASGDTSSQLTFPAGGSVVGSHMLGFVSGDFGTTVALDTSSPTSAPNALGSSAGHQQIMLVQYVGGGTAGTVQLQARGLTQNPTAKANLCSVWGVRLA